MLSTFPFDLCSSRKILDYRGVPGNFKNCKSVRLTPAASSSSACAAFPLLFFLLCHACCPLCSAPAAAAHRRRSLPSATSSYISLPRVALYLSHLGSSFSLPSSALDTHTPPPCGRHRAAAVASSTPSAQLLCCARISTPGSSSTYSSHPLASSSPLAPGTPSPLPL
jgi:hypothetical protein